MTVEYDSSDLAWSRSLFMSLAEGAVWGVPRSGLVFTRLGEKLVLTDRMPHITGMPLSADELRSYQDEDFAAIRTVFGAAGIQVDANLRGQHGPS